MPTLDDPFREMLLTHPGIPTFRSSAWGVKSFDQLPPNMLIAMIQALLGTPSTYIDGERIYDVTVSSFDDNTAARFHQRESLSPKIFDVILQFPGVANELTAEDLDLLS